MGWIIDIVLVLLLILIVYASFRKGFLRSVLSLGGFLISTIFSFMFGKMIAEMLFDSMAKPWLTSMINEQVVAGANNNLTVVVDNLYLNLPGYISGPIELLFGSKEQMTASLQSAVNNGSTGLTDSIVGLLRPMMVTLISILVFIILFILCMLALRVIDRMLIRVRRLPVIGTFDGLLGGIVGVLKAFVWLVIIVFLAKAVILLSSNSLSWMNNELVDSTFLFKYAYDFDLPGMFAGLKL